uniref:Uncharacterized protein n=1 Tax=Anopheles atroparvus TaxID=41427 RepID=A0AAG5D770_ANOAO
LKLFVAGLAGVVFAERTATLGKEALSLEVLFAITINGGMTYGAVEALAVVVVVQGLHPLVAGLDGESAGKALGGEQIVPVLLAVGIAFLEEERAVAELLAAVRALEALRMELLADGIQAIALRARRCQELLEAVLAVQVSLLLDETDVGQRTLAVSVVADEVIRTPDASQCGNEWTSANQSNKTQWHTATGSNRLVHHATSTVRGGGGAGRPALVERLVTTLWSWHGSRSERGCSRGRRGERSRNRRLNRSRSLDRSRSWGRGLPNEGGREWSRNAAGHRREGRRRLNLGQRAHRKRSTERFRRNASHATYIITVRRLRATVQIGVCVESSRDGLDTGFLATEVMGYDRQKKNRNN